MILAVLAMLVGCGGGGSSSSGSSSYDLADYLIANKSNVKSWDLYKVENDVLTDHYVGSVNTTELYMGDVRETPTIGTFYLIDGSIKLSYKESATKYKRKISIGDTWINGCVWEKHHNSLRLKNDESYEDVLELSCTKYKFYFSKNKGNVAKIGKNSEVSAQFLLNGMTIKENLTLKDITENDNKNFRLE